MKKEKPVNKKKWIPELDPFAYPKISAFVTTNAAFLTQGDNLMMALENPSTITENPVFLGSYAAALFISYNFFRTLTKFKGPNRLASFIRYSNSWRKIKDLETDSPAFESLLDEMSDRFDPSTHAHHGVRASAYIKKGEKVKGIEEMLKSARHSKRVPEILPGNIYRELVDSILDVGLRTNDFLSGKLKDSRSAMDARYERLSTLLTTSRISKAASIELEGIKANARSLEDTVAYGAIKDYMEGADDRNWAPFLTMLDEITSGSSLEEHLDDVTEGRNDVFRLPGIYMKRYASRESLDKEMDNLKRVFKDLKHVLSHGVAATIKGEEYFIAPEAGITLFDAIDTVDSYEKDELIKQALDNLSDIQVIGEKESFREVEPNHFTERMLNIRDLCTLEDGFTDAWHEAISAPLCTIKKLYYKDSNQKNYLKEDDLLYEIDFEGTLKKPFGLDIVNILGFEKMDADEEKHELVMRHMKMLREKGIDVHIDPFGYELCRAQRHLELMSYRYRDLNRGLGQEHLSYARHHAENAIDALSELSNTANNGARSYSSLAGQLESSLREFL